jgi:hypothetical protein
MFGDRDRDEAICLLNLVGQFKAIFTLLPEGEVDRQAIAAVHGTAQINAGVNDGKSNSWVREKGLEVDASSGQCCFVGFVTDTQDIGKVNNASGIGIGKSDSSAIGKGHL